MKKIVIAAVLAISAFGMNSVFAQNNGGNGNSSSAQSGISMSQAVHILRAAYDEIGSGLGMNFGQMVQAYLRGKITIEIVAPDSAILREDGLLIYILSGVQF